MKYDIAFKIKNTDNSTSISVSNVNADGDFTVAAAKISCVGNVKIASNEELTDGKLEINSITKDDTYIIKRMDKITYSAIIIKKTS